MTERKARLALVRRHRWLGDQAARAWTCTPDVPALSPLKDPECTGCGAAVPFEVIVRPASTPETLALQLDLYYMATLLSENSDRREREEIHLRLASLTNRREEAHEDLFSSNSFISYQWPEPLAAEAFHGLAGEIVRVLEPETEADPAALLVQLLVAFGNAAGRDPYFEVEADRHNVNLFAVLVGLSAKGRKGTSWGHVRRALEEADSAWRDCLKSGLSSGEGLIWCVRDEIRKTEPVKKSGRVAGYEEVVADPGVKDKRLLVFEPEFSSVLRVLRRDGNTLSGVIRQAWDNGALSTLTKNSPARATDAHVSIIGHVTRDELRRHLDTTEAASGFGNRILWLAVKRSKSLPEGGTVSRDSLEPLVQRLKAVLKFARGTGRLRWGEDAQRLWWKVYPELSEGKLGLFGAVTSRAEAQVLRLACVYALLDETGSIRIEHLAAALAIWEYAEASARYVFGDALGDPVTDVILSALRKAPEGLSRTDLANLFGRNRRAGEVERALQLLVEHGLTGSRQVESGGRPKEIWTVTAGVGRASSGDSIDKPQYEINEKNEKRGPAP